MNVVQVRVGPTGFVGASEQAIVDYIRATFADRPKPELIVTVGGPAAVFARRYRQQLFPDTPLLLASVDQRFLRGAALGDNDAAVAFMDPRRVVDGILQLLPQTRQVFMVMGSGQIGKFWHRELENEFMPFHDRLTFIWSRRAVVCGNPAPLGEPATRRGDFLLHLRTDAAGAAYADERVLADLYAAANAPLFGRRASC